MTRLWVEGMNWDKFCDLRQEFENKKTGIKNRLFSRVEHKCVLCGSTENLTIDHIIPLRKGGTNDDSNMQILCGKCNRLKGVK